MSSDIEKVVGKYIELEEKGSVLQTCCPFHGDKTPSFTVFPDTESYYCFAGDTRVITRYGVKEIGTLLDNNVELLNGEGEWQECRINSYGKQRLYELSLTRNKCTKTIKVTGEHKWYTKRTKTAKDTTSLKKGDLLQSITPKSSFKGDIDHEGFIHGAVFGDGHMVKDTWAIDLHGDKIEDLGLYFSDFKATDYFYTKSKNGEKIPFLHVRGDKRLFKDIPGIGSHADEYLAGFIAGYLATDGHVAKDGTVCLNSTSIEDLLMVRDICTKLGIVTYSVTTQNRIGIDGKYSDISRIHFLNNTLDENLFVRPQQRQRFSESTKSFGRVGWSVVSVRPLDEVEEVFCTVVEGTHKFALEDNILTGNCFGCGVSGDAIEFVKEHEKVGFVKAKETVQEILGKPVEVGDEKKRLTRKPTDFTPMPHEAIKEFQSDKVFQNVNYRGIRQETDKFFRTLSKVDEKGNVIARYYPETRGGKLAGYKCRNHPKDFTHGKVGTTGIDNDLSGQHLFQAGGKYCLMVGGECDKAAAYQMFIDHQRERKQDGFEPMPVVSPTSGEGSAAKQAALQYDWFDTFDIIVIGMDNDEVGRKAAKDIAEVLPKEKVRIATWSGKDPNKMLQDGKHKQFIRDFYNAKEYEKTGIKTASEALEGIDEFLTAPKITFPPFMHRLQAATRGGIRSTGAIVNVVGDTSIGKSYFADNLLYHWLFNSPKTPTVISLERTAEELAIDMLSLHLKKNLMWFSDGHDAVEYLHREDVKALYANLFTNEYGQQRFYIVDERDGDPDSMKRQMEKSAKKNGANLFVIDPLTDFLRSLGNDGQEDFMMWEKFQKKQGHVFLNVLHTRKPMTDKDGNIRKVSEFDVLGSGTFIQSADMNIILNRNKMADDPVVKNTTEVDLPKCRGGTTGYIGGLYYDPASKQQYDFDDFFRQQRDDYYDEIEETIQQEKEQPQELVFNTPD